MSEDYVITAKPQYRRVYKGTEYTMEWEGPDGVKHTAKCRNLSKLQRFARNGFSTVGLRRSYGIVVVG